MKKNIFYLGTVLVAFLFLYNLFFASLSYNAQTPPYAIKTLLSKTLPEGWGFFTKSPRESMFAVYRVQDGILIPLETRNSAAQNLFGFSRKARKISMEVSIIAELVKKEQWVQKEGIDHIDVPSNTVALDPANLHFLKDEQLVLVKSQPVPWAWKDIVTTNQIPYEIVRVKT